MLRLASEGQREPPLAPPEGRWTRGEGPAGPGGGPPRAYT